MARSTFTTAPSNSTSALFRAWGKAISDGLQAVGWVKTSDTGQIDWTTVAAPSAASTSMGYEIFRMADSLQGTAPWFLKLEYGSGSAAATPSLWFTVGSTTDGAGTLGGQLGTRTQITITSNSTTSYQGFVAGANNRLTVAPWAGAPGTAGYNYVPVLVLERSHDSSGADTSDGIMCASGANSTWKTQYVHATGPIQPVYSVLPSFVPTNGTASRNSNVYPGLCRCWTPGESSPFVGILTYIAADISAYTSPSVTLWTGGTGTFLAEGTAFSSVGYGGSGSVLLRYD